MNSDKRISEEIDCEMAQLLMVPVWAEDAGVSAWEEESFATHLSTCVSCAGEYEETQALMEMLRTNWGRISQETESLLASTDSAPNAPYRQECQNRHETVQSYQNHWQVSDNTQAFLDRDPLRHSGRNEGMGFGRSRIAKKVAAVAAAIVVCLGAGLAYLSTQDPKKPEGLVHVNSQDGKDGPEIKVTENGLVLAFQKLLTTDGTETREFMINNRHRLVLNTHTTVSIDRLIQEGRLGCLITLRAGQMLAHVEHDGNPFEVRSAHGTAVITGTVFDVSVTQQETTLTVAEGSVRFESSDGSVNVAAGHRSTLKAQSRPSTPAKCDAKSLLAWAYGDESSPANQESLIESEYTQFVETLPLELAHPRPPIDLESLDYEEWVESKRVWFKGQFPWIFVLQETLVEKALLATSHDSTELVEVQSQTTATVPDYPELLIQTGDIWQIVYPERVYRIIPTVDPESLLMVGRGYGLNKSRLAKVLASLSVNHLQQGEMVFGVEALEKWLAECERLQSRCESEKELEAFSEYSQSITEYLENTRALIWLCVRSGSLMSSSGNKAQVLDELQAQVAHAHTLNKLAQNLALASPKAISDRDDHFRKLMGMIEHILDCESRVIGSGLENSEAK